MYHTKFQTRGYCITNYMKRQPVGSQNLQYQHVVAHVTCNMSILDHIRPAARACIVSCASWNISTLHPVLHATSADYIPMIHATSAHYIPCYMQNQHITSHATCNISTLHPMLHATSAHYIPCYMQHQHITSHATCNISTLHPMIHATSAHYIP